MMSDDRRRQSGQPDDDDFSGALDDIFGSTEPTAPNRNPAPGRQEKPASYSPPVSQPNPAPGRRPESEHNANPAPSYPARPANAAPAAPGRSIARIAGIGCAAVVGITIICMAVLIFIGLVVGDDTTASSAGTPQQAVSTSDTVQQANQEMPSASEVVPLDTFSPVSRTWRVAVNGSIPDATRDVLQRNQFNQPPAEGYQFFIATVSVRNTGQRTESFQAGLLFRLVNASGHAYSRFDDYCGVIPDEFENEAIAPGETRTGNVCWQVLTEDADSLVMMSIDFAGEYEVRYFSLYR